jgi:hypothetical protein
VSPGTAAQVIAAGTAVVFAAVFIWAAVTGRGE